MIFFKQDQQFLIEKKEENLRTHIYILTHEKGKVNYYFDWNTFTTVQTIFSKLI